MADPSARDPRPPEDELDTAQEILGGFPRHLTQRMIAEREGRAGARSMLGLLALGAGLAMLALALPDESLRPRELAALDVEGRSPSVHHGLVLTVWALGPWRFEQAAFLLSALLYGACLPLLVRLGQAVGVSRSVAIGVSLVVLLTPAGWDAATSPGPLALELLLEIGLFSALWRLREDDGPLARVRIGLWGLALVFTALGSASFSGGLLAPGGLAWLVGGLGLGWAGLAALLVQPRNESEERPPAWLLLWAGGFLLLALRGWLLPLRELDLLHLLPLAALGGFDLVGRRIEELRGWELPAAVAASLPLLLAAGVLRPDPDRDWREQARAVLEYGDILVTSSPAHAHLAEQRWGLETWSGPAELLAVYEEQAREAMAAGRRVVLDIESAEAGAWDGVPTLEGLASELREEP